jgi:carboxyl-terminal processing protease
MRRQYKNATQLCLVLIFMAIGVCAIASESLSPLKSPSHLDRFTGRTVVSLMNSEHLLHRPLDDEISKRWFDKYIKLIDPTKKYFNRSDIDQFSKMSTKLDDSIKRGDLDFAYKVFNRYLERVDQRITMVDELLETPFDFTKDEYLVLDPKLVDYAGDETEARGRWHKEIKYQLLLLKTDDEEPLTGKEAIEKLRKRYHRFANESHQQNNEDLLELYLTAMTTSFDPHTTYMSPSTIKEFKIAMSLNFEGIGATLKSDDNGSTEIVSLTSGGAAEKQGELKPKDQVVAVGQGTGGEMTDVVDMRINDVIKLIRGKADTLVRLKVIPHDGGKKKVITITRAKVEVKDRRAQGTVFETKATASEKPYKAGVIRLPSFYADIEAASRGDADFRSATGDVREIVKEFKSKDIDVLVVDLRDNGGGFLMEAVNLTGLFIEKGPVVQVKSSDYSNVHLDRDPAIEWSGPLVVLINKGSASASEIFAGAIQDYRRGLIVGDPTTLGKGTVQSTLDLAQALQRFRIPGVPDMGTLKVTIQQFYRPNGASTQRRGVLSDIKLPSLMSHLDIGECDLDYPLKFDEIDPVPHTVYPMVKKPIIERLEAASTKRISASESFQKLGKQIELFLKRKKDKRATLNEKEFSKELALIELQRNETDSDDDPKESHKIKRDYYLDEVLQISVDYTELLKASQLN